MLGRGLSKCESSQVDSPTSSDWKSTENINNEKELFPGSADRSDEDNNDPNNRSNACYALLAAHDRNFKGLLVEQATKNQAFHRRKCPHGQISPIKFRFLASSLCVKWNCLTQPSVRSHFQSDGDPIRAVNIPLGPTPASGDPQIKPFGSVIDADGNL